MRLFRCKNWKIHLWWHCWGSGEGTGQGQESHLHLGWVRSVLPEHTEVTPPPPQTPRLSHGLLEGWKQTELSSQKCRAKAAGCPWPQAGAKQDLSQFTHQQCQHSMYKPSLLHSFQDFLITFQHGELAKAINIRWEFRPPTPTASPAPLLPRTCCYPQLFADSLGFHPPHHSPKHLL